MWRMESDAHLRSTMTVVDVLDRAPIGAPRRRPRVGQPIDSPLPPAGAGTGPAAWPPTWVDDGNFDLHYHLQRIALPEPGNERQLFDLAQAEAMAHSIAPARRGAPCSSRAWRADAPPTCSSCTTA